MRFSVFVFKFSPNCAYRNENKLDSARDLSPSPSPPPKMTDTRKLLRGIKPVPSIGITGIELEETIPLMIAKNPTHRMSKD